MEQGNNLFETKEEEMEFIQNLGENSMLALTFGGKKWLLPWFLRGGLWGPPMGATESDTPWEAGLIRLEIAELATASLLAAASGS